MKNFLAQVKMWKKNAELEKLPVVKKENFVRTKKREKINFESKSCVKALRCYEEFYSLLSSLRISIKIDSNCIIIMKLN